MIGENISHYRILQKLGEGGMGVVYKAQDIKLERIVALKFLPPHLSNQEEEKKRFIHEAKAASALEHSNICTIHEIDETKDGQLFIVMSYLEGKTLREKIDSSPLKVDEAIRITIQAAEGLKQAHEKGIVHRDIKPVNIMITTDGTVKIMDFGLAKLGGKTKLTQMGTTLGTFSYMSPEQSRGEDVDRRTDIWSLGVVLYEMLTGQLPFKGDYEQAVVYSIVNEEPEPMTAVRTGIPMELERIVNKALAKNPDERYQHIDDLLADLRTERKNLEYARAGYIKAQTSDQHSLKVKAPQKRNYLNIIIPAAVAVILAIIFFVFNPFKFWGEHNPSTDTPVESLAVMYFENIPDPADKDHTGEMLTNLLITSLSQIKGLEVISRERLFDIQKDLVQSDTKILSSSLASQIAERAGVNTMLVGSILKDAPRLAVTTRLIDVKTGTIISSNQVLNYDSDKIFSLVDTLSILIQNNFRDINISENEVKPVAEVTTNSPEAYRAYLEGIELSNKLYYLEAISAYKRAIELDSNFAMAYFRLAQAQSLSGYRELAHNSLQKAFNLANNASEPERLQILATKYVYQDKPYKAIDVLDPVMKQYPHELYPYNILWGLYFYELLEPEKSIAKLQYGLKNNPSAKNLWNMISYCFASLNQRDEAFYAVNKYISLAPAEPNPYDSKGDIYAWFKDYDSSSILYKKALSFRKDFESATKLGCYAVLNKNYEEAAKYFQMRGYKIPLIEIHKGQIIKALKESGDIPDYYRIELYSETGQYSEMLKLTKKLSRELKKDPYSRTNGREDVAWALAKNGKFSEAHKLIKEIQADVAGTTPRFKLIANYYSALILFEEGKYELALKQFKEVFNSLPPNHEPNIFYAICLLKCGELSESIEQFRGIKYWPAFRYFFILHPIPGDESFWPIPAVKAYYWLGVAYEQLGQKEKAFKEYEEFLDIWKDADFNSPEIKDAKMRVEKLKGVASK